MINLQTISGLPLLFDEINEKFRYGEGIIFDQLHRVPLSSMLPGLLNKSLRYPETVYLEHKNIRQEEDTDFLKETGLHYDVVMLPSGLMGVEFIRSHIFYTEPHTVGASAAVSINPQVSTQPNSVDNALLGISEIIECLSGSVTVLLQRNEPKGEWDFDTKVNEGLVVKLSEGEKFVIPRGYYYTFINTRVKPVVFSRFYAEDCVCDYTKFKHEQGLAYFAIRKNAKQEIVLNPRYREIPKIQSLKCSEKVWEHTPELRPDPLYVQIKNHHDELKSIFA